MCFGIGGAVCSVVPRAGNKTLRSRILSAMLDTVSTFHYSLDEMPSPKPKCPCQECQCHSKVLHGCAKAEDMRIMKFIRRRTG